MTALVLSFLALFYRWFVRQHSHSFDAIEDWGHAYLVPIIAGFLIWQRRGELARVHVGVYWPGLAPTLFGVVSYIFGVVGVRNHMFQGFSILISLFGVVLLVFGPAVMRRVFPAIAYLVMGITISQAVMLKITWPLQQLASQGAWVMLSIIGAVTGFTVDVSGNTLTVINAAGDAYPLNVAEACSGMRMVVAFLALAGAVALLSCKLWWQRVLLLLLAPPVALLMNVVRVAALGLATLFDPKLASGEAHTFIGTLLLFPSLGLFMGVVWILNQIMREDGSKPSPPPAAATSTAPVKLFKPATVVAIVAFASAALGFRSAISAYQIHLTKSPIYAPEGRQFASLLPTETHGWEQVGRDKIESAEIVKELGTENYLSRTFRSKDDPSRVIELHAAYYTGQIDTVPHVPERCFVGGGLQIGSRSVEIPLPLDRSDWRAFKEPPEGLEGRVFTTRTGDRRYSNYPGVRVVLPFDPQDMKLRVTEFVSENGASFHSGYFFIANGGTVASAEGVRLLAFELDNDYAYYAKIQFTSFTGGTAEDLAVDAADLLDDLLGDIMLCVPNWVDVIEGRYPPAAEG
ncbi:MAG: exosortase/archaeosortase family protein [Planctomycetota bacterium]